LKAQNGRDRRSGLRTPQEWLGGRSRPGETSHLGPKCDLFSPRSIHRSPRSIGERMPIRRSPPAPANVAGTPSNIVIARVSGAEQASPGSCNPASEASHLRLARGRQSFPTASLGQAPTRPRECHRVGDANPPPVLGESYPRAPSYEGIPSNRPCEVPMMN
jgi:hypothetical protein